MAIIVATSSKEDLTMQTNQHHQLFEQMDKYWSSAQAEVKPDDDGLWHILRSYPGIAHQMAAKEVAQYLEDGKVFHGNLRDDDQHQHYSPKDCLAVLYQFIDSIDLIPIEHPEFYKAIMAKSNKRKYKRSQLELEWDDAMLAKNKYNSDPRKTLLFKAWRNICELKATPQQQSQPTTQFDQLYKETTNATIN